MFEHNVYTGNRKQYPNLAILFCKVLSSHLHVSHDAEHVVLLNAMWYMWKLCHSVRDWGVGSCWSTAAELLQSLLG